MCGTWQRGLRVPSPESAVWIKTIPPRMVSVDRNSPGRLRLPTMRVRSLHLHSQECQRRTHIHRSLRRRSHHCWDNEEDIATIKSRLSERFDMKDLGIATRFLGMEIEYGNDGSIKIHQNRYIQQLLERHGMADCNPVTTPLDTSVKLSSITSEEASADAREYA